jgi:hypothetical protein
LDGALSIEERLLLSKAVDTIKIIIWIVRFLFGVLALGACLMLVMDLFIFDAPGSVNLWSVNLAAAPLVYLVIYALSLSPPNGINGQPPTGGARLFRAFLPLAGLAWCGLAWLAIDKACGGNFTC